MWSLVLWVLVVKTVCIRYVSFNYVMCAVLKISARKKKIFYYRKRENDYVIGWNREKRIEEYIEKIDEEQVNVQSIMAEKW